MAGPLVTHPMGEHAVLVETGDVARSLSLAHWARSAGVSATDIVPAAATVLFAGLADPTGLAAVLAAWPGEVLGSGEREVTVPVVYDGADLDFAARRWGMTRAEAVATHAGLTFVVAFCGFAPGFAYLAGLPVELALPRLETPRTKVPAGSVAVADQWTGVYPSASPGGWRLLGRTELTLFDPDLADPALLVPGTRVRLTAVEASEGRSG